MMNVANKVVEKLKTIFDPEIPVDIYNLGLIYKVDVKDGYDIFIEMTLTTASCPSAAYMPEEVESVVKEIDEVNSVHVHVVWEPRWTKDRMSVAARQELGW